MATKLYLENMGFRAIGRILGVSNRSVLNWVRQAGELIEACRQQEGNQVQEAIDVIELDELWHYVDKKRSYGFG